MLLNKLFDVIPFTHVMHLAAQAGVRYCMENPSSYVHSNIAISGEDTLIQCWSRISSNSTSHLHSSKYL
jgi:UDP-glucose 4-epimerase